MATLHAAFSFPYMTDSPAAVTNYLHFYVPCLVNQLFSIQTVIAKSCFGFRGTPRVSIRKFTSLAHYAHAATTAAGNRFEQNARTAVFIKKRFSLRQRQRLG